MIDLTITTNEFSTTITNGNPDPQDLSEFPVVDIVGPRSVQVREGGREERRERGREGGREGGRGEGYIYHAHFCRLDCRTIATIPVNLTSEWRELVT